MSFYFISDNSYFIEGLKLSLTGNDFDKNSIYVNINEDDFYFHPGKDDIVVLAVANINVRRKILKTPEIALCKLAIMGRAKTLGMLKGVFLPWFFSREMTSRELANALIHIKTINSPCINSLIEKQRFFFTLEPDFHMKRLPA